MTQHKRFSMGTKWILNDVVKSIPIITKIKLFSYCETCNSYIYWFKYQGIWARVNFSRGKYGRAIHSHHLLWAWNSRAWLCIWKAPKVGLPGVYYPITSALATHSSFRLPWASWSSLTSSNFPIPSLGSAFMCFMYDAQPTASTSCTETSGQVSLPQGTHSAPQGFHWDLCTYASQSLPLQYLPGFEMIMVLSVPLLHIFPLWDGKHRKSEETAWLILSTRIWNTLGIPSGLLWT